MSNKIIILKVKDMKCFGCADNISSKLKEINGINDVDADPKSKKITVRFDIDHTDENKIKNRIS